MRFVRLVVDHFQGIEHAEVDFSHGLNVLHGPNDIGKSTLATAMRAVLLLPASSAEGGEYASWQGDYTPAVQLTFCDAKGVHYRVTKSFGIGTRASARLERSRDGSAFDTDATARQVEEKLRTLLDWGIPPPGGKTGARKGLPEAFLSRVLLGEQTDVDAILRSSFEDDPSESGRLRLTAALQAFAQDPRFKTVLDQAQAKVDELFTPTGQRKRGKGSPFLTSAEEVKHLQAQLQKLQERQGESDRAQARVRSLLIEVQALRERRDDEAEVLRGIGEHLAMAEARSAAASELEHAEAALREIDEQWALVEHKKRELTGLEERLGELKTAIERAAARLETAKTELEAATEVLRRETSEEAALARTLKKAQIENSIGRLEARRSELQAVKKDVGEAARCSKSVATLEGERHTKQGERAEVSGKAEATVAAEADVTARLGRLEDLEAYARWMVARDALDAAVGAAAEVQRLEARSLELQADVDRLLGEARTIAIPAVDEVNAIGQLEQQAAVAEAALGGGLSVSIRPAQGVEIRVRADSQTTLVRGPGETLEATRTVEIAIPGVVDLEVFAGDAEARKRAEMLRRRWSDEARPVLERAGAANAGELRLARARADELVRTAGEKAKERESIDREAGAQRASAGTLEALRIRAAELELALEGRDRSALATLYAGLTRGWETSIEKTRRTLVEQRRQASAELLEARSASGRLDGELLQLDAQLKTAKVGLEDALRKVPNGDPALQLPLIEAEEKQVDEGSKRLLRELADLELGGNAAADNGRRGVDTAEAEVEAATHLQRTAAEEIERHRSTLDQARGEYGALKANAERLARGEAFDHVKAKRATLDGLPASRPATTEDRDRARERVESLATELQSKRDELSKAEGALTHVGGSVVAEQCDEVRSALTDATSRQKTLETDAQAWRLLCEVLQESESVGMKHLGRVLGDEVGRRFQDLTSQRYGTLELGPNGQTLGIHAAGTARSVFALSVGTREQLATLLRLAIAESLGSAIVLDDHLVEADPARLQWFLEVLRRSAKTIQVLVLTCRRRDYEYPEDTAGGRPVAWIDANQAIKRSHQAS